MQRVPGVSSQCPRRWGILLPGLSHCKEGAPRPDRKDSPLGEPGEGLVSPPKRHSSEAEILEEQVGGWKGEELIPFFASRGRFLPLNLSGHRPGTVQVWLWDQHWVMQAPPDSPEHSRLPASDAAGSPGGHRNSLFNKGLCIVRLCALSRCLC